MSGYEPPRIIDYVVRPVTDGPSELCEKCGRPMRVRSRFRFDHEEGDTARDRESLAQFAAMGVELGADVTLWYCDACDFAVATFAYPDR